MKSLGRHLETYSSSLMIIALFFVLIPLFSYFGLPYSDILTRVFIIAIYALSFDLLLGYTGLLNFGQSLFFGMGAYITAYTLNWAGMSFLIALIFSATIGALLGILLSLMVKRSFKGIPFTFFSLAFAMIVLSIYQKRLFQGISGGEGGLLLPIPGILRSIWALRVYEFGFLGLLTLALLFIIYRSTRGSSLYVRMGLLVGSSGIAAIVFYLAVQHLDHLAKAASYERLIPNSYYLALTVLIAVYFLARKIVSSPVGKVWQSIRENETRTAVIGYNPFNYKLMAVAVSGAIAGLAGGLYAPYLLTVSAANVFDPFLTIKALIFAVLGGLGTLKGAILGAGIILLLEHFLNPLIGEWTNILIGVIFIIVVFTMPRGIIGKLMTSRAKSFKKILKEMIS